MSQGKRQSNFQSEWEAELKVSCFYLPPGEMVLHPVFHSGQTE